MKSLKELENNLIDSINNKEKFYVAIYEYALNFYSRKKGVGIFDYRDIATEFLLKKVDNIFNKKLPKNEIIPYVYTSINHFYYDVVEKSKKKIKVDTIPIISTSNQINVSEVYDKFLDTLTNKNEREFAECLVDNNKYMFFEQQLNKNTIRVRTHRLKNKFKEAFIN